MQVATKMEEPELLNEVPGILKRLAKTVAYAFYEPELIVTLSLLTKEPYIDEDTMIERLQFDKRQMRQTLSRLKNDKLVKQRVIKEKVAETGNFNIFNFYFINYKLLVNVVKYKLDHVRRKLETEEQQIRNRPSFQCQNCEKHFSDLEIDRLVDMESGELKCSFCHGMVEEDPLQLTSLGTGSSLGKFNEQMETIFNLLKECENINLAPEVLEPTPSTEGLKTSGPRTASNKQQWSTDRSVDLYDQRIQINVGDEVEQNKVVAKKQDLPAWITHSTVFEEHAEQAKASNSATDVIDDTLSNETNQTSKDIMSDLLAHESEKKKPRLDLPSGSANIEGTSRTTVSPDTSKLSLASSSIEVTEVADMGDSDDDDEDDDDEDDEVKIKVGDEMIPFSDVTDEIIAKMTTSEHDAYLEVYNEMAADGY